MGRSRQLQYVRADVYKRADIESAIDRFPASEIDRYINQGRAALRDEIIGARGRSYFRKDTPQTITTAANTSRYNLNADFYQLISVRVGEEWGDCLHPFTPLEEPFLRAQTTAVDWPTHYELQESTIELLPIHRANLSIIVEYIPVLTDVVGDTDPVEGYNGWEDYIVDYAALQCAVKDDEPRVVQMLTQSLARLSDRISRLAPKRDRFRAERVKDVHGYRRFGWWSRG
jgi:hypothetical protein